VATLAAYGVKAKATAKRGGIMAIYHASCKPLGRAQGRSAVAAAAYRSGTKLRDERTGLVHDFTLKSGVVHAEIFAPHGIKFEREALWSAAELAEPAPKARTAREWVVALPHELNADERRELVREFAANLSERFGVAVDLAIHLPSDKEDGKNHHAHLLLTTRVIEPDGSFGDKSYAEWAGDRLKKAGHITSKAEIVEVRKVWADIANRGLEKAGHPERIDHRSHRDRGLLEMPSIHLGHVAAEMENNGEASERGDINRYRADFNDKLKQARAEVISLCAERDKRAAAALKLAADKEADMVAGLSAMTTQAIAGRLKDKEAEKVWYQTKINGIAEQLYRAGGAEAAHHLTAKTNQGRLLEKAELAEMQAAKWRAENPIKNWIGFSKPADIFENKAAELREQSAAMKPEIIKLAAAYKTAQAVEQDKVAAKQKDYTEALKVLERELVALKSEHAARPLEPQNDLREQLRAHTQKQIEREGEKPKTRANDGFDHSL
jgi:hypothetical protein